MRLSAVIRSLATTTLLAALSACSSGSGSSSNSSTPGTLGFSNSSASANQSAGLVNIPVTRSSGASGLVSLSFATSNGSATAGADFTATTGLLNWADGDASTKYITVLLSTATPFYGTRSFTVTLSSPTNSATLGAATLSVTITGSLASPIPGTISFSGSTFPALQSTGSASLTVARTLGSNGSASINFSTSNGTAAAGVNYTATTGTLNWADGDSAAKTISVPLNTSVSFPSSLSFTVNLSSPSGSLGTPILGTPSAATVSITPTTYYGSIAFAASTTAINQSAGTSSLSVTRTGGSSGAVTVQYATSDGSATAGTDYTAASGTLTWANGDSTAKTITVPISTALAFNGAKTFTVTLSAPTGGAALGSPIANTATITGTAFVPANCPQFNFNPYKLTLPIDQYGGTGGVNNTQYAANTISTSQILAGFVDPYFYADASCNIVFTAPSNGAVTTPGSGSDHTRSEFRELYYGTGADSNNDWNSSIGGTLTATAKLLAISADTDESIIGQIHGQTYVFMLLNYLPKTQSIDVDIFTTNTSTSGDVRTPIITGVGIGSVITYKLVYSGNTITATVNGVTQSFPIDSSWANTPVYFKLGAYSGASNTGNPVGDQTQTSFSAFSITHP